MATISKLLVLLIFQLICQSTLAQELELSTNPLILTQEEQMRFRELLNDNEQANALYQQIVKEANQYLDDSPSPIAVINYEGMLDTDELRIISQKSLEDVTKVNMLFYASYGDANEAYAQKVKEFVMAWARTYIPEGNPINENKFVPIFWGYYLFRSEFSEAEQALVENWMLEIAGHEIARPHTPNNNWQTKRLRMLGIIGGITNNEVLMNSALIGFKKYINSALYADGTSIDLKSRDALHYHTSGLKPLLTMCINLSIFDPKFNLYDYVARDGGSIQKSVAYVEPYARGEKVHKEWVNTQVELDKKRAEAGIAKYQPGILYDPKHALPMFELACYFNEAYFEIIAQLMDYEEPAYTLTWDSMLNSPLVRGRK